MAYKKTKIVATISDRNCSSEFIRELWNAGMNVIRINTAHQELSTAKMVVDNVRKISDKIAILVDTKGPELRTTAMQNGTGIAVKEGDEIKIYGDPEQLSSEQALYVNYKGLVNDVPIGATILIDDGEIAISVKEKHSDYLLCVMNDRGIIKGKKSGNVPNTNIRLPAVSKKDREFIQWAIENDIDFIAHSFVRSKHDVMEVQDILDKEKSHIKIIAKIENQEGVDHIDEILTHSYGIMVARGDLGVEIPAEKIPVIQRKLVDKGRLLKKPVIIATQMLHSMIVHSRPTRAEVSDVANAIYQRADAIMLSGETANGAYPVETVKVMSKIALEIEQHLHPLLDVHLLHISAPVAYTLSKMLVEATNNLPIKALLCDSISGRTARYLSAYRPKVPVYAQCYHKHVMRELALSYGIQSSIIAPSCSSEIDMAKVVAQSLVDSKNVEPSDLVGILVGRYQNKTKASIAEINEVGQLLSSSL
ncbi:MAG: pyruvate kinase [Prevotellaceae bacterium]|jgi:pyruvate kinase|nr:pyruvate kinase [Prevotellaceae bacterium]